MLTLAAVMLVLAGCEANQTTEPKAVNPWLVNTVNDMAVRNAIIRQQALFPYHFVVNGAQLNDLGKQDLDVLASHYRDNPGQLVVRQGDASEELYAARVQAVVEAMRGAGVDVDRGQVTDGLAQGDGMPSERVIVIVQERGAGAPSPEAGVPIRTQAVAGEEQ